MTTLYITHQDCLEHETPQGHPECAERLRTIETALQTKSFESLRRAQAPLADRQALLRVHPESHIATLEKTVGQHATTYIDGDTVLSSGSWQAALRAAGGAIMAVDEVMSGRAKNAFVAARPHGHHAETSTSMGFCLLNNAVIAARHAQAEHHLQCVAIIDWDVHHGNGTQEIVWNDPTIFYGSTHQMPLYPGTGAASERGAHDQIVNVPLLAGDGRDAFEEALKNTIIPALKSFSPNLIIISAGFDAHEQDPLGNLRLTEEDFAWATRELMTIAESECDGKIVSLLEGGYDLDGLSKSVAAHITELMRA